MVVLFIWEKSQLQLQKWNSQISSDSIGLNDKLDKHLCVMPALHFWWYIFAEKGSLFKAFADRKTCLKALCMYRNVSNPYSRYIFRCFDWSMFTLSALNRKLRWISWNLRLFFTFRTGRRKHGHFVTLFSDTVWF